MTEPLHPRQPRVPTPKEIETVRERHKAKRDVRGPEPEPCTDAHRCRCRIGYTRPQSVPEHRELRRHFSRAFGCGAGLVTRTHGTFWVALRWGKGLCP